MGKFPDDAPQVVLQRRCPPLRSYSKADVMAAGREMQALLANNPAARSPRFIADYKSLRDQCRSYETVK